jgi:hypothetical protein
MDLCYHEPTQSLMVTSASIAHQPLVAVNITDATRSGASGLSAATVSQPPSTIVYDGFTRPLFCAYSAHDSRLFVNDSAGEFTCFELHQKPAQQFASAAHAGGTTTVTQAGSVASMPAAASVPVCRSALFRFGSYGSGLGEFDNASGMAVHGGLLFVADQYEHRVQVLNARDGSFVRLLATPGKEKECETGVIYGPFGLAIAPTWRPAAPATPAAAATATGTGATAAPDYELYVSERVVRNRHARVSVFSLDGRHLRSFGCFGRQLPGAMLAPAALAVAGQHVFIVDNERGAVHVFRRTDGLYEGHFGDGALRRRGPVGIAIVQRRLFVADSKLDAVLEFDIDDLLKESS